MEVEIAQEYPAGVRIVDACAFLGWLDNLLLSVTMQLNSRKILVSDFVGEDLWVVEVPDVELADVLMEDVLPELAQVQ